MAASLQLLFVHCNRNCNKKIAKKSSCIRNRQIMGKILVTGGAGYIGSHTCVELLHAGFEVVVVDNLKNSKIESLKRVEKITGKTLEFVEADIRDQPQMRRIFQEHRFAGVIHFAGLKAVGESAQIPLAYYDNNVAGSVAL